MPEIHINVDVTKVVDETANALLAPVYDFLDQLHSEGRISDAEIQRVREAIEDRRARLPELVRFSTEGHDTMPQGDKG